MTINVAFMDAFGFVVLSSRKTISACTVDGERKTNKAVCNTRSMSINMPKHCAAA